MKDVEVFRLAREVHFEPPRAWSVQARYAFVYTDGKPFTAGAGRLAIYLGPRRFFDGKEDRVEHLYRFSDGRVGALNGAPDDRFAPVEDPEIVALAAQVRSLPELVAEKGLRLETISRLEPFALIVCPLCRGTEFTTIDFASVWCDTCNTRFATRMTAGDPGVVVDADPTYYDVRYSRYIIPRRDLTLTVVLKDFGYSSHPEGKCGEYCVNGTTYEERVERMNYYVSTPTSLRDPTSWCGLEVYDWSLYGQAERPDWHDRELRDIIGDPDAAGRIYGKKVRSERLPSVDLLAEGKPDGEGREWWYLADVIYNDRDIPWWPVWWKVRANLARSPYSDAKTIEGWVVTDRTLCPVCLRPADDPRHQDSDWCQRQWKAMGWKPEQEMR